MVVTQGLTESSVFKKLLDRYGPGIHHVAYEVEDLDEAVEQLRQAGVALTSEGILRDPTTGLRQIFISNEYAGHFIELIERTEATRSGVFTNKNMAALANTMTGYFGDDDRIS